jgi:hypothetical protein
MAIDPGPHNLTSPYSNVRETYLVTWTQAELEAAIASPDWGHLVVDALNAYFATDQWLVEPCTLVSAELEIDPRGRPVLLAIYDHPGYHDRLGYRRRLDDPHVLEYLGPPAQSMAGMIARYELSEPCAPPDGTSEPDSNGVRWWEWGWPNPS